MFRLEERDAPAVNVLTTFNGLKFGDPGNNDTPPDTIVAAGPNSVIEAVNASLAIYNKSGALQASASFSTFFGTSAFLFGSAFSGFPPSYVVSLAAGLGKQVPEALAFLRSRAGMGQ